ncbi:MAG: hypothetical protein LBU89_13135 [Fibromonadaceae bacterium]|nr:hypothetical protein [Fibromonadaceae bacterium]
MEKKKNKLIDIVKAGALSVALTLGACATQEEDEIIDSDGDPKGTEIVGVLTCEEIKEIESMSLYESSVKFCEKGDERDILLYDGPTGRSIEDINVCGYSMYSEYGPRIETGELERDEYNILLGQMYKQVNCLEKVSTLEMHELQLRDMRQKCNGKKFEEYKSEYNKQKQECMGI